MYYEGLSFGTLYLLQFWLQHLWGSVGLWWTLLGSIGLCWAHLGSVGLFQFFVTWGSQRRAIQVVRTTSGEPFFKISRKLYVQPWENSFLKLSHGLYVQPSGYVNPKRKVPIFAQIGQYLEFYTPHRNLIYIKRQRKRSSFQRAQ